MSQTVDKPKPYTQRVSEMIEGDTIIFPANDYDYVRSMVSGPIKLKYPLRVFGVSRQAEVEVKRFADKKAV